MLTYVAVKLQLHAGRHIGEKIPAAASNARYIFAFSSPTNGAMNLSRLAFIKIQKTKRRPKHQSALFIFPIVEKQLAAVSPTRPPPTHQHPCAGSRARRLLPPKALREA
jgi:hypothetical protein